uniref:Secreted protein n=1 Tax=Helianthus annuus TaxID=4232 RepID=A0A251VFW4_HELAN
MAPWWAIETSVGLSFLLLLGHGPVLAEHGACSSSDFSSLLGRMPLRVRTIYFCSFSCIYVRISCLFASFVNLSSFHPENTKGRQKHSFSNISTQKGLVLCLI